MGQPLDSYCVEPAVDFVDKWSFLPLQDLPLLPFKLYAKLEDLIADSSLCCLFGKGSNGRRDYLKPSKWLGPLLKVAAGGCVLYCACANAEHCVNVWDIGDAQSGGELQVIFFMGYFKDIDSIV